MSNSTPQFPNFRVTLVGAVAVLAYNHPETGNSLSHHMLKALLEATKWAVQNPAVRVIVQTGTGKFFTTGKNMAQYSGDFDLSETLQTFKDINETLIKCPKVLIAAVNGPAVGYGTTCLALYDLVYSVPDAYFFTPFSKWALCPEGCSSVAFPLVIGHQKAAALLLAGDRMTATELSTAGLISKIIPAPSTESFMTEVLEVAERIAGYPPVALAASKKLLNDNRTAELLAANARECECLVERLSHQECQDGIIVFAKEQEQKKARRDKARI
ncbi:ClpP/crotonase-like domain-containing protein [Dactylonectria estremocensis]|uniref:ClpP/crotonase-like domain-containing protein n=1 Tax=Dactylonectria estremocensis TaxID=1079267 RepID=A0A9P9EL01_9HYPO|nr:ClpP/crotonase-like domain-containing protein [Dactylonectria estremocensis]